MSALEPVVQPPLANRERAADLPFQLRLHELAVLEEALPCARAGVFDPLAFAGEAALERAAHLVDESGPREVDLDRDVEPRLGHLLQVVARRFEVVGDREHARQQRLLALLERRERAREQQIEAGQRGMRIERRVLLVEADLLEVRPLGHDRRAQEPRSHCERSLNPSGESFGSWAS